MSAKLNGLTPQQCKFVQEYLIDLCGTKAAIRAGYSAKTAESASSRLLSQVKIKAAVQAAMDERAKRTNITADYVLGSLKDVVERCMQRVEPKTMRDGTPIVENDDDGTPRPLYEFNASGANQALTLLGKHLKLFTDKVEHGVDDTLESILSGSVLKDDE